MTVLSRSPSCVLRDGDTADPTSRPVLQHARDALHKAGRFADLSEQAPDVHFESVIHGAYFAMFHAARAALLAVDGMASTDHARVGASFAQSCAGQGIGIQPNVLVRTRELHAKAHHSNEDLTKEGQALRAQMRPFLALCAELVELRAQA